MKLQTISTKSMLLKVFIILIAMAFAFFGGQYYASTRINDQMIELIDETITLEFIKLELGKNNIEQAQEYLVMEQNPKIFEINHYMDKVSDKKTKEKSELLLRKLAENSNQFMPIYENLRDKDHISPETFTDLMKIFNKYKS